MQNKSPASVETGCLFAKGLPSVYNKVVVNFGVLRIATRSFLFQGIAVVVHGILLFARLVKLRGRVKCNIFKHKELPFLNVAD